MANIKKSASELIGHTPLLEVTHYEEKNGITDATVLVKLEYFNPARLGEGPYCPAYDRGGGEGREAEAWRHDH